MRPTIRDFVALIADAFPIQEPIYEFGAFQVAGQEDLANLRPLFPGLHFVGADMREGPGVDTLLNLHDIDRPSESVGTVLCLDTLEHVEYPHRAIEEVYRILKPGGVAVISSVMDFPIHDYPFDYWRFTPEAFRSILQPFELSFVGFAGTESFPHTVVGLGFKKVRPELEQFMSRYAKWQAQQVPSTGGSAVARMLKLLSPPILHLLLSKLYSTTHRLLTRSK